MKTQHDFTLELRNAVPARGLTGTLIQWLSHNMHPLTRLKVVFQPILALFFAADHGNRRGHRLGRLLSLSHPEWKTV